MVSIIKSVAEFEKKIESAGDKLVVIDFYASWCGPCKDMNPHLSTLADHFKDRTVILKVDIDKFSDISDYYKIKSLPTFLFMKNRRTTYRFAGADPVLLKHKMTLLAK